VPLDTGSIAQMAVLHEFEALNEFDSVVDLIEGSHIRTIEACLSTPVAKSRRKQ